MLFHLNYRITLSVAEGYTTTDKGAGENGLHIALFHGSYCNDAWNSCWRRWAHFDASDAVDGNSDPFCNRGK